YELIKEYVDHGGNKNKIALKLSITRRQVDRLIIKYKEKGKSAFVHGNRARKPISTLDKSISEDIILLYKNKYQGWNFTHFKEFLEEQENIKVSYKFIYNVLTKEGILSPKARKKTKRDYTKKKLLEEKKINLVMSDEKINYIINHEIALEDSHPRGEKPKYFGEVIEQDGSIHLWFGEKKTCLHLAIDKATSTIVGAYFDKQETLNGYYQVFHQILTNYGIPYKFLTDNRTVFNYLSLNPDKRTSDKDVLTQYGYACKRLGIELETTSVSQAKGLIERTNGTFQGRLVNELKLNGITTIDEANRYLLEVFLPTFNQKFALDYKNFPSAFEQSPDTNKINYTLAILTLRKIDNGNSIKFKNKYYQPYLNNELKCFIPKTECLVIESFNGDLMVSIDENIYEMHELIRNKKYSDNLEEVPIKKEKKKYIPPMSHPFKAASFKRQMQKAHTTHVYA
ncbi:ISNCY family transposase, partial [Helicobacter japonicus]|uniref:ISNCY family transposase n=1 Tax=Helicobacter japonicus TaxID=425400 RepID=UPI0026185E87